MTGHRQENMLRRGGGEVLALGVLRIRDAVGALSWT
jgi:hypothetical protein